MTGNSSASFCTLSTVCWTALPTVSGDGASAGARGVGDRLGAVSVVEQCDLGVGAVSVLDEYLAFGMVPEVDGLGDNSVVLGLEELFDEVVDEGSLARAEVLAFGGLAVSAGGGTGGGA